MIHLNLSCGVENCILCLFKNLKLSSPLPLKQVTSERHCRAVQEAHHDSQTYLCLLASTRNHQVLHNLYHTKGERSPEEVAGVVGLRLPTQPGGKGWEK